MHATLGKLDPLHRTQTYNVLYQCCREKALLAFICRPTARSLISSSLYLVKISMVFQILLPPTVLALIVASTKSILQDHCVSAFDPLNPCTFHFCCPCSKCQALVRPFFHNQLREIDIVTVLELIHVLFVLFYSVKCYCIIILQCMYLCLLILCSGCQFSLADLLNQSTLVMNRHNLLSASCPLSFSLFMCIL